MFDFRLKVFYTVAKRLNFTKAAEELHITQPAVSKHIKEIEYHLKTKVFDREGTKIKLTPAGKLLFGYCEKIFAIYSELEFEISLLNQQHKGQLRIGASTTIAQYVLPAVLAAFHEKFADIKVSLTIANSEQIEHLLAQQTIDLGVVENRSKNTAFKYSEFLKDEIVLVTSSHHPLAKKGTLKAEQLKNIALLLREPGSGTLQIIMHHLKHAGIHLDQLQVEMQLGSSESIKSYLLHSDCAAFLSIYSILNELKENKLSVVDIKDLSMDRYFYFIEPQGNMQAIGNLFMDFAIHYNFK
ncbi:LysR substrate-binding domain-containing protein [Pedobacter sp. KR3-3]|uniref:LysR substrate-binding domain-containing protein n=1 Tax=Pedobacter albus TaxID=3113905 RepID=A0ABU7IAY3_9SPHI|nr:LysR substrate-binding domain-containing protein [Pedobacter sp. KR3-3]MEE1946645.1 LysR substrate-binding domain-containing protein [Pedobacter sp. KR3-3]